MCGRYTLSVGFLDIRMQKLLRLCALTPEDTPELKTDERMEIRPGDYAPVLMVANGATVPTAMQWGFTKSEKSLIINARIETASEKKDVCISYQSQPLCTTRRRVLRMARRRSSPPPDYTARWRTLLSRGPVPEGRRWRSPLCHSDPCGGWRTQPNPCQNAGRIADAARSQAVDSWGNDVGCFAESPSRQPVHSAYGRRAAANGF